MFGKKKDQEDTATYEDTKEVSPADITATTVDKNSSEEDEVQIPPITWREIKALRKAKYDQTNTKFDTAYVLLNKRTGQIVEINACSDIQACNIIGWKPRKVKVLEVKDVSKAKEEKAEEITESLGVSDEHQKETA